MSGSAEAETRRSAGKQIGVYALARDLADVEARARRVHVWQVAGTLAGIVLLAGVVLVAVRRLVLAPVEALGRDMTALAAGDASHASAPLETYADELRAVAEGYETLRAQALERHRSGEVKV